MIPQYHTPWRSVLGLARSDPDSRGFGGKLVSPPSPLVALYLDAAARSWDLTFLLLRRPGDPRQGALRASAQRVREDGCYRQLLCPGEWVGGSMQQSAEPGSSCSNFVAEAEGGRSWSSDYRELSALLGMTGEHEHKSCN